MCLTDIPHSYVSLKVLVLPKAFRTCYKQDIVLAQQVQAEINIVYGLAFLMKRTNAVVPAVGSTQEHTAS
jgi:hypothetical protein